MNYNTYLLIFGLNPNSFKHDLAEIYEANGVITCFVEQRTDINRSCPHCKSENTKIKDYNTVVLNATFNNNLKCELIVKKVRFVCKDCKISFTPSIENINRKSNIIGSVKRLIILEFERCITFTEIAKKYNVSIGTVFNTFDETYKVIERSKMPEILCIDEFHFNKNYDQNYCCVIVDFKKGQIVDVLKNRRKEYLDEYFSKISADERENVKYFISDMYDEYATVKKKYFPNAIHIIDRFHIVLQLTTAINKRRVKVMKQVINDNKILYNFMKNNWELFEQRRSKIPNKTYTNKATGYTYTYDYLFDKCLSLDHDLSLAYDVLQSLLKTTYLVEDDDLSSHFKTLSSQLETCDDEDIKKVGKTYIKWKDGIIAAYKKFSINARLTNAIAENTNNRIKTLIKISYGLKNFERMRNRAIIISKSAQKKEA